MVLLQEKNTSKTTESSKGWSYINPKKTKLFNLHDNISQMGCKILKN